MAPTHRLAGTWSGALYGWHIGLPWWACVGTAAAATLTSAGILSPDADQFKGWRRVDKYAPDELLGWGGPLKHRGITHWPALPVAAAYALHAATLSTWLTLLLWALIIGWVSHLRVKISPKAAATWLDCPKHYRFEYVDRPRKPRRGGPWAHITLGNVVHETLGEWMTLDPADRTPRQAQRILRARWRDEGFRDGEQAGLWFTSRERLDRGYCARPDVQATVVRATSAPSQRSTGPS
jgi:hypothetical protein